MKIGQAIRRLRHSQGRTLQQLADAAGGNIQTGYLSRIEQDKLTPSVYIAAKIARALGTTVDQLLLESERGSQSVGIPSATRRLIPVTTWEGAAILLRGPYNTPTGVSRWMMPPMEVSETAYGLVLQDDSMQALEGISFTRGGVIIVEPQRKARAGDYVVAGELQGDGLPLFRQLTTDGRDFFLRARNPQYPMRPFGDDWQVMGVVAGQVIDLNLEG